MTPQIGFSARKWICRATGFLILVDLGVYSLRNPDWFSLLLFPMVHFLAIGAAFGLILYRRWGFWATYLLAGVSLLPIPVILPLLFFLWNFLGINPILQNFLNRIVLLAVVIPLHISAHRAGDFASPAESLEFTFEKPRKKFSLAGPGSPAGFWGLLIIGTMVSLLPFGVFFFGCRSSDWTCSGDGMAAVALMYGGTLLLPGLIAFILIFLKLVSVAVAHFSRISISRKIGLVVYFLTVFVAVHQIFLTNFLHFEFLVKRNFIGLPFAEMDTSTLLPGPDLNQNDIRDDLEPILEAESDPLRRGFNRRYALLLHRLLGENSPEQFRANAQEMLWVNHCLYNTDLDPMILWRDIRMMNANTLSRFTRLKEIYVRIDRDWDALDKDAPPGFCQDISRPGPDKSSPGIGVGSRQLFGFPQETSQNRPSPPF